MLPFRVLSRTNLAYRSRYSSLNPRLFILLQTLFYPEPRRVHSQKSQLLCNQANPASFSKTPGVGYPECLYATPGVGAPQHLRAEPRFRRHMRHVAPLSPVASLGCAYFPSPQGCTTPNLRFSLLGVYVPLWQPFPVSHLFSQPSELPGVEGLLTLLAS